MWSFPCRFTISENIQETLFNFDTTSRWYAQQYTSQSLIQLDICAYEAVQNFASDLHHLIVIAERSKANKCAVWHLTLRIFIYTSSFARFNLSCTTLTHMDQSIITRPLVV